MRESFAQWLAWKDKFSDGSHWKKCSQETHFKEETAGSFGRFYDP